MTNKKLLPFYGGPTPFSNFYPSKFQIDGTNFFCSEQYFMYMKAVTFKDMVAAENICKANSAGRCKMHGRLVKGYDDTVWKEKRYGIMKTALLAKFSQNADIKKLLLDTKNHELVEASPGDKIWGVGLSQNDPDILDKSKWKGQNLLGKCLDEVREIILQNDEAELCKTTISSTRVTTKNIK
ncbi:hypothetical protein SNEBB_002067 [Seison nebaliae]|nr:hypothetical protein SNEBB_002067 [Seison nebaliae]